MLRQIIKIDEDLCNGCELCTKACHEGAIKMINGKAKLIRDDFCDGLGNCLPVCPTGAITFEMREAADFDEEAVRKHLEKDVKLEDKNDDKPACGCPSMTLKTFNRSESSMSNNTTNTNYVVDKEESNLQQWPVQIQLVPPTAPYLKNANLLIAADCAAYAHPSFNKTFMKNKVTIIGCPKLDHTEYSKKLEDILTYNTIRSVTIVRMEVPCCGGLAHAATEALRNCGKMIPWSVVTVGTDGTILE